jgi:hypothetical protein
MASNYNLKRNSRVFFTTNLVAATGKVSTVASSFTTANTQELTVLDGFTFTQTTTAQAVTVSEAGASPARGQRNFNTALNPVDFSFSTYIRPNVALTTNVDSDESDLWNALFGTTATSDTGITLTYTGALTPTYTASTGVLVLTAATSITASGLAVGDIVTIQGVTGLGANQFNAAIQITAITATAITGTYLLAPTAAVPVAANWPTGSVFFHKKSWVTNVAVPADTGTTAMYAEVTPARSNVNQLLPFGLIIVVDGISYTIDNCAMDQASIDFGLDAIATVAWTGKGTQLNQLATNITMVNGGTLNAPTVTFAGGITGTGAGKSDTSLTRYITNKLSTVSLKAQIGGGGTSYNMALTGGSIQIANNINFVTPANLGVLNVPIGYYTGTRAITGTLNAYLKTGTNNTADLLSSILTASTGGATELKYQLGLAIGGSSALTRVEALINGASLQIPTVDASQDIVSTAIQFTAQGADSVGGANANYDVSATNDIRVRYFAA